MTSPHTAASIVRRFSNWVAVGAAVAAVPFSLGAQTPPPGTWVGFITSIRNFSASAAELRIEPRNERQSRARLMVRGALTKRIFAWDIVKGRCNEEGLRIAPQATFLTFQTNADGTATVSANIPKLETGKMYYVRLYEAGSQPSDLQSWGCANVLEQ